MSLNYKIIGKRIREIRLENDLTQAELAEKCNLSPPYISYVESGKDKKVSLDSLVKLANTLGVTVDIFLRGYQKHDLITYKTDLTALIEDCDCYEKQIIYDVAKAAKTSLRANQLNQ